MTSWLTGLAVAVAVLAVATAFGVARRLRDGRLRVTVAPTTIGLLATLGVDNAAPVTLLQFSSEFCAPCRTVRQRCAEVAAAVPGVRHVEVDVAAHLDTVRELHVRRTPTLLVIDAAGRIVRRAVGVSSRDQVVSAVNDVLAEART